MYCVIAEFKFYKQMLLFIINTVITEVNSTSSHIYCESGSKSNKKLIIILIFVDINCRKWYFLGMYTKVLWAHLMLLERSSLFDMYNCALPATKNEVEFKSEHHNEYFKKVDCFGVKFEVIYHIRQNLYF